MRSAHFKAGSQSDISYTCNILQITSSRNSPRKHVSLHTGEEEGKKKKHLKPRRQGLIISGGKGELGIHWCSHIQSSILKVTSSSVGKST